MKQTDSLISRKEKIAQAEKRIVKVLENKNADAEDAWAVFKSQARTYEVMMTEVENRVAEAFKEEFKVVIAKQVELEEKNAELRAKIEELEEKKADKEQIEKAEENLDKNSKKLEEHSKRLTAVEPGFFKRGWRKFTRLLMVGTTFSTLLYIGRKYYIEDNTLQNALLSTWGETQFQAEKHLNIVGTAQAVRFLASSQYRMQHLAILAVSKGIEYYKTHQMTGTSQDLIVAGGELWTATMEETIRTDSDIIDRAWLGPDAATRITATRMGGHVAALMITAGMDENGVDRMHHYRAYMAGGGMGIEANLLWDQSRELYTLRNNATAVAECNEIMNNMTETATDLFMRAYDFEITRHTRDGNLEKTKGYTKPDGTPFTRDEMNLLVAITLESQGWFYPKTEMGIFSRYWDKWIRGKKEPYIPVPNWMTDEVRKTAEETMRIEWQRPYNILPLKAETELAVQEYVKMFTGYDHIVTWGGQAYNLVVPWLGQAITAFNWGDYFKKAKFFRLRL